jgi:hypothetical protein
MWMMHRYSPKIRFNEEVPAPMLKGRLSMKDRVHLPTFTGSCSLNSSVCPSGNQTSKVAQPLTP